VVVQKVDSYTWSRWSRFAVIAVLMLAASSCATLDSLRRIVAAPRFEEAPGRRAEIRLLGPTVSAPLGGAGVRLWARVTNPNPFGFTLSTLRGTLRLDETRAATVDLPLGLPLEARGQAEIPIEVIVSFADLPQLGDVIRRGIDREPIGYELDGVVAVHAGAFGTPEFGPMTLLSGTLR
jgi:hypothetical protein